MEYVVEYACGISAASSSDDDDDDDDDDLLLLLLLLGMLLDFGRVMAAEV